MLDRLRHLAPSDPSAEAALNAELRRRNLPPEWSVCAPASPDRAESPPVERVEGWGWVVEHLRAAGVEVEGMRLNDEWPCDEDGYGLLPGAWGAGVKRDVIWPDGPYRRYLTAVVYDSGERRILYRGDYPHAPYIYPEWLSALTHSPTAVVLTTVWNVARCKGTPRALFALLALEPSRFGSCHAAWEAADAR